MKFLVLAILSMAQLTFAADSKPILAKSSGGGFMMPEVAGGEVCELFRDKVIISRFYGRVAPTALKTVEEKAIVLTGDIQQVIEKAKAEELTSKPNNLCDGPATSIRANLNGTEEISLFSTGGCGSPRRSRDGIFSSKLKEIINVYCPKTYDFGTEG